VNVLVRVRTCTVRTRKSGTVRGRAAKYSTVDYANAITLQYLSNRQEVGVKIAKNSRKILNTHVSHIILEYQKCLDLLIHTMTKIAIIYYSLYGHIAGFAESIKKGVEEGGATCDIYQVEETLSDEILGKMGAPPKKDYPVMTADMMTEYDGFLFGISGRFGSVPAQLKVCFQPHHEVMGFLLASLQNSHISSLQ
jgi:hypothetical protein